MGTMGSREHLKMQADLEGASGQPPARVRGEWGSFRLWFQSVLLLGSPALTRGLRAVGPDDSGANSAGEGLTPWPQLWFHWEDE